MARSRIPTLLALDQYADIMGLRLSHFNNLREDYAGAAARPYWTQAMHDVLARQIAQAEALLRDGSRGKPGLRFDVAPTYHRERLSFDPGFDDWTQTVFQASRGHIAAFGRPQWTLIEADAPVIYAGDVAQIALTLPEEMAAGEIQVFYRVADGAPTAAHVAWRMRPLDVFAAGSVGVLTGRKAQFVLPAVLASDTPGDYDDPDGFVAAVDVYRVTVDSSLPVEMAWDAWGVSRAGDPSASATQHGTAHLDDAALGTFQVRPATVASGGHVYTAPLYHQTPDSVVVEYVAGYPLADPEREQMDITLESAVVRLANVLAPDWDHPLNDLASVHWENDRALPGERNPLQPGEEDCPFGLAAGARYAWQVVRQYRIREVAL